MKPGGVGHLENVLIRALPKPYFGGKAQLSLLLSSESNNLRYVSLLPFNSFKWRRLDFYILRCCIVCLCPMPDAHSSFQSVTCASFSAASHELCPMPTILDPLICSSFCATLLDHRPMPSAGSSYDHSLRCLLSAPCLMHSTPLSNICSSSSRTFLSVRIFCHHFPRWILRY